MPSKRNSGQDFCRRMPRFELRDWEGSGRNSGRPNRNPGMDRVSRQVQEWEARRATPSSRNRGSLTRNSPWSPPWAGMQGRGGGRGPSRSPRSQHPRYPSSLEDEDSQFASRQNLLNERRGRRLAQGSRQMQDWKGMSRRGSGRSNRPMPRFELRDWEGSGRRSGRPNRNPGRDRVSRQVQDWESRRAIPSSRGRRRSPSRSPRSRHHRYPSSLEDEDSQFASRQNLLNERRVRRLSRGSRRRRSSGRQRSPMRRTPIPRPRSRKSQRKR